MTGSGSSLVARYMLDNIAPKKGEVETMHGKIPHELINLLMRTSTWPQPLPLDSHSQADADLDRTVAIDTSGLKKDSSHPIDRESAERLQSLSSWPKEKLKDRMEKLDDELSESKKDLGGLDVRALLRRDWKGDAIETKSDKYPLLALGFASAPVSLEEQILRTPEGTTPEWFGESARPSVRRLCLADAVLCFCSH